MTGKGNIALSPNRQLRFVLGIQIFWLGVLCILGAWWARLLLNQAERITELERAAGMASIASHEQWEKTQRMLFWESATFFVVLVLVTGILFWVYYRDMKRTRGLQAFFASVTHELRTPLTSIRLQAESLSDNIAKDEANRDLVRRLLEDTMRLESQVERTLELARVEGGGPVYTQPLRISPWIERFLSTWRETYGSRLEVKTNLKDVSVMADASAFQVILGNLIENSIRHSKKDHVQISLSMEKSGSDVFLNFEDNGDSFEGDIKTVGEIFQKGAGSQGAGVGLYLVRVLMERMGGGASFSANPGFKTSLRFKEGAADGTE